MTDFTKQNAEIAANVATAIRLLPENYLAFEITAMLRPPNCCVFISAMSTDGKVRAFEALSNPGRLIERTIPIPTSNLHTVGAG